MRKRKRFVQNEILHEFTSQMNDILKTDVIVKDDIENNTIYRCGFADCSALYNTEKEASACCGEGFEIDDRRVMQWWIVSDNFYYELRKHGEAVINWDGLKIWGRREAYQDVHLDPILLKIVS